jgi:hypothetical protein
VIEIAIVTTAITTRKTARRDGDTSPEIRKGSIWTRRGDSIRRRCLECLTAAGVRLELQAFFERYSGKTFSLQVILPKDADRSILTAIESLVPAQAFDVPHSYRQFGGRRDKAGCAWRGTPFDYGFVGQLHPDFAPYWAVEAEPMILLKSSAGDHYTYPSTDDDEADDTTHVHNGRAGGLKKQENRLRKDTTNA